MFKSETFELSDWQKVWIWETIGLSGAALTDKLTLPSEKLSHR